MMKHHVSIAISFTAALLGAACNKSDNAGTSVAKTSAAPPSATKLPKLALQIDVPGEVEIGDAVMADGNLLQSSAVGALQVERFDKPQTLDEAKEDAQVFNPKHLEANPLADGWAVTYDNTGSMGANYFVTVRRDLGGKPYKCSTTTGDKGQAAAVLAACKTLRM